jgi:hypothetical protein
MCYSALKRLKNNIKEALKMRVASAKGGACLLACGSPMPVGRGITATSGQIWAGNGARFNDWLLKGTFYRTTARTAREGQKRASGEVARRGVGFIYFLVGFTYTPPVTLGIIKTDDSRVRNVSDLYPGGSCLFRCQTGP